MNNPRSGSWEYTARRPQGKVLQPKVLPTCLLLLINLRIDSGVGNAGTPFVSPPRSEINGRRLAMTIPTHWTVIQRDQPYAWSTVEYDFTIARTMPQRRQPKPGSQRIKLPFKQPLKLDIAIIRWSMSRARRKGDLAGVPFRTTSQLRGIYQEFDWHTYEPGNPMYRWALTLPIVHADAVFFIAVEGNRKNKRTLARIATQILKSVRYVQ